jgi:hypothetical protein
LTIGTLAGELSNLLKRVEQAGERSWDAELREYRRQPPFVGR